VSRDHPAGRQGQSSVSLRGQPQSSARGSRGGEGQVVQVTWEHRQSQPQRKEEVSGRGKDKVAQAAKVRRMKEKGG